MKQYVSTRGAVVAGGGVIEICQEAAATAWPSTTPGWLPRSNYRNYDNWDQGCEDAMNYVGSGGQGGLQVPFNN